MCAEKGSLLSGSLDLESLESSRFAVNHGTDTYLHDLLFNLTLWISLHNCESLNLIHVSVIKKFTFFFHHIFKFCICNNLLLREMC